MDVEHQLEFLKQRPGAGAASLIGRTAPDDAADLILELDQHQRLPILELLPNGHEPKMRALLGYHPQAAGGLMRIDFLCLDERTAVGTTREAVRDSEISPEARATIFTHDGDGRLGGAIRLVPLRRHEHEALLVDVVDHACPQLHPDREVCDIAVTMSDVNLTVAPVVDRDHRMLGVVTVDDLLETLIPDEWKWRADANREG